MFRFWYEKFVMRFVYIIAIAGFIGVLYYALQTEVDHSAKPVETIAPFKEKPVEEFVPFAEDIMNGNKSVNSLAKPHRTSKEIQGWLAQAVSESMSFDLANYKENAKSVYVYFSKTGFQQYQAYLQDSGIFDTLKSNQSRMSVFVEEAPLLLNNSEIEGVYRWLYQVPVTVSFIPLNATDLTKTDNVVSKQMNLRIQVRRANIKGDPDVVQVESWKATRRK